MTEAQFKQCPSCDQRFSLRDILNDPTIVPLGLTFESSDLETNIFYFDHQIPGCGTTFMIPAIKFIPAIEEPIAEEILFGTVNCPAHCTRLEDWAVCDQDCFHAPFRRLLISMMDRKGMKTQKV